MTMNLSYKLHKILFVIMAEMTIDNFITIRYI